MQIDSLKIGQSCIRKLRTERSVKALSESIIVMGHRLGLSVVAQGVETARQFGFLIWASCDFAPGYLFSRPIPLEEFKALLQNGLPVLHELPDVDG